MVYCCTIIVILKVKLDLIVIVLEDYHCLEILRISNANNNSNETIVENQFINTYNRLNVIF